MDARPVPAPPAPPAQPADDEFKHWGLSLHAGVSIPHPDFSDLRRPGPNFGVDLEYRFNKYFSLEGIYTYHRFGGETFGPFVPGGPTFELDPLNLHQLSVNGKIYAAGTSPVRPFFNLGGGAYFFSPGSTTRGGVNVGGGLQFDVTETMAVEGAYNFHNVFGFSDVKFSTVQGSVRFRF
jgi:opacity protein-like surface antigen